jgi:hypothetical protein
VPGARNGGIVVPTGGVPNCCLSCLKSGVFVAFSSFSSLFCRLGCGLPMDRGFDGELMATRSKFGMVASSREPQQGYQPPLQTIHPISLDTNVITLYINESALKGLDVFKTSNS